MDLLSSCKGPLLRTPTTVELIISFQLWDRYIVAKQHAVAINALSQVEKFLLEDTVPEVRAAAVYALGRFMGPFEHRDERTISLDVLGLRLVQMSDDVRFVA